MIMMPHIHQYFTIFQNIYWIFLCIIARNDKTPGTVDRAGTHHSHFTDEGTKAQRGWVAYPSDSCSRAGNRVYHSLSHAYFSDMTIQARVLLERDTSGWWQSPVMFSPRPFFLKYFFFFLIYFLLKYSWFTMLC